MDVPTGVRSRSHSVVAVDLLAPLVQLLGLEREPEDLPREQAAQGVVGRQVHGRVVVGAVGHALEALDGAWIASPDPAAFGTFASAFAARNGGDAGTITALAYDAAGIANTLRAANTLNGEGLLDGKGFRCVTGPVRFRTDGSVARDFAILVARPHGYEPVAVSSGS